MNECYYSYIGLSDDFKYLKIVNKKPNDKLKYTLEADPEKVQQEIFDEHIKMMIKKKGIKNYFSDKDEDFLF